MPSIKIPNGSGGWIKLPTLKGDTGNGIASITLNPDYTLTITYTSGATATTTSIRGAMGDTGDTGATGNGIASITLISGNHAAGTTDTYRITMTSGATVDFTVYNGADGVTIVNDLVTGGADKALSAEQGKNLSTSIKPLTD